MYIKMIRISPRNEFRMSVCPPVHNDNLSKNLVILIKLGTRILWHYEKVGIAEIGKIEL